MVKAAAVKAYTMGLSLRQVIAFLGGMGFSVSRESTRRWFLKAGELLSREDKTVQPILPNIQDKNNREMDKGMDSLKSTVS